MLVQALDHFVVPVNDIVVAEDFYVQVFGGKILKRNGLNVKTQVLGPHTFMDIAGKRIGAELRSADDWQTQQAKILAIVVGAGVRQGAGALPPTAVALLLASLVTTKPEPGLPNERILSAAGAITVTDGGPGQPLTVAIVTENLDQMLSKQVFGG